MEPQLIWVVLPCGLECRCRPSELIQLFAGAAPPDPLVRIVSRGQTRQVDDADLSGDAGQGTGDLLGMFFARFTVVGQDVDDPVAEPFVKIGRQLTGALAGRCRHQPKTSNGVRTRLR